MKNGIALWLAVVLALCLGACQTPGVESSAIPIPSEKATPVVEATPTPVPTETVTPSPEPTYTGPWPDVLVHITDLDLSSYEGELSPEEWEALQGFFPVLNNEVPMLAAHLPFEESVTPTEEVFFYDIFDVYATARDFSPTDQQQMMSFTLIPVTGEGLDLILAMNELMGWYLLIHREGEQFYAVYMPIRRFDLQTDGLYMGSGGAAVAYYHRLRFANGTFTEELLANTDWGEWDEEGHYLGYFAIGGEEVTEAEFNAWREETLSGDAVWYPARQASASQDKGIEE